MVTAFISVTINYAVYFFKAVCESFNNKWFYTVYRIEACIELFVFKL